MTITHTLSRIVAIDTQALRFIWSDGYEETHGPDWTGFTMGVNAGFGADGEYERYDGTDWSNPGDEVLACFLDRGGVVEDYVAPEPVTNPPHLSTGGLVRFTGTSPSTVLEAIRMAGATRISKGRYRLSHESPMPSDQYSVLLAVMDPLPRSIRITARTPAYVEIRITDLDGVVQDPAEVTVRTERVITQ